MHDVCSKTLTLFCIMYKNAAFHASVWGDEETGQRNFGSQIIDWTYKPIVKECQDLFRGRKWLAGETFVPLKFHAIWFINESSNYSSLEEYTLNVIQCNLFYLSYLFLRIYIQLLIHLVWLLRPRILPQFTTSWLMQVTNPSGDVPRHGPT